MGEVGCSSEIASIHWSGTSANNVKQPPESTSSESDELSHPPERIAKVEVVSTSETEAKRPKEGCSLRLPFSATLGVSPITLTLTERQRRLRRLLSSNAAGAKGLAITPATALLSCGDIGFIAGVERASIWKFAWWNVLELVQIVWPGSPIANTMPRDGHVATLQQKGQEPHEAKGEASAKSSQRPSCLAYIFTCSHGLAMAGSGDEMEAEDTQQYQNRRAHGASGATSACS